jgi:hypothetical protein
VRLGTSAPGEEKNAQTVLKKEKNAQTVLKKEKNA